MPKNYNNAKIYIIRSYQTDDVYIGSTIEKLSKRISNHRCHFKRYTNNPNQAYLTSFKLIERDDHYIELYEEYPCQNKEQLNKREGELIRSTPNCVNKCIAGNMAGRTEHEYQKEYQKEYREKTMDNYKKYQKDYYDKKKNKKIYNLVMLEMHYYFKNH